MVLVCNKKKIKMNTKKILGDVFCLPFGETKVMNHYAKGRVYIKDVFGEPEETFIKAIEIMDKSVAYGCIIPDKIKVICVCGLEIKGRYLELIKIVDAIKKNTQTITYTANDRTKIHC
jgi:hypothetical protein